MQRTRVPVSNTETHLAELLRNHLRRPSGERANDGHPTHRRQHPKESASYAPHVRCHLLRVAPAA